MPPWARIQIKCVSVCSCVREGMCVALVFALCKGNCSNITVGFCILLCYISFQVFPGEVKACLSVSTKKPDD